MFTEVALGSGATMWLSRQEAPSRVPADGCVDLIVHHDSVLICGPQTQWLQATGSDSEGLLGLRLAAGAAPAVLPVDFLELRDQVVDLTEALGEKMTPLRELMLRAMHSLEPQIMLAPLVSSMEVAPWANAVRACATVSLPSREVACRLGWSERTLRRRMRSTFGYGYTTLVRIKRANRARQLLSRGIAPSEAATRAGYADQPHLNRELVRLTGMTPVQLSASVA